MFKHVLKLCLITLFYVSIAACSSSPFVHEYIMSGQVASVEGRKIVICIGSEVGAEPGMLLDVYTIEHTGEVIDGDGIDSYSRKKVGEIEIETIIDKHFARGSIIKGKIQQHDVAELRR